MSTLLRINQLKRSFGGIRAIDDVSFSVRNGIITGVIGPNGAGKTTLFNLIAGFYKPTSGSVVFNDQAITGRSAATIARYGLVRTFQMTQVFSGYSVYENLYRAALFRQFPKPWQLFTPATVQAGRTRARQTTEYALELIGLSQVADTEASSLAYGLQKILGVGMALTAQPKALLMDEPAAGLNPVETEEMSSLIERIHQTGVDIVVVEHDMGLVMRLCKDLVVLVNGQLLATGPTEQVKQNPEVIDAYLGADLEEA